MTKRKTIRDLVERATWVQLVARFPVIWVMENCTIEGMRRVR